MVHRTDSNPNSYPDVDFFMLSRRHATMEGRLWLFGEEVTIPALGKYNFVTTTNEDKIQYRSFRLGTTDAAAGGVAATLRFFEDTVYSGGTPLTIYPANRNISFPVAPDAPVFFHNATITSEGNKALPDRHMHVEHKASGEIENETLIILKPNTNYMIEVENAESSPVVFLTSGIFSFPDF